MPVLAWLLSPVGRWAGAAALALAVAGGLYACGRQDGADAARRQALERSMEARDAADRAAAAYRGDGAVRRLRDGTY